MIMVQWTPLLLGIVGFIQVVMGMIFSFATFGLGALITVPLVLMFWGGTILYLYMFCSGLTWYTFIPGVSYSRLIWNGIWGQCEEKDIDWKTIGIIAGAAIITIITLIVVIRYAQKPAVSGMPVSNMEYAYTPQEYTQGYYQ